MTIRTSNRWIVTLTEWIFLNIEVPYICSKIIMFTNWPIGGPNAISSLDASLRAAQLVLFLFASFWKVILPSPFFEPRLIF